MLRRQNAECFVTTEKDAVRLSDAQRIQLEEVAPLRVARLRVSLEDEPAIVRRLMAIAVRK
jgi:tetraacyldisaccharide 4'-kinase